MSEKMYVPASDLKVGRYVIIEGVPCKIVAIDVSKPGKHGAAKMRITGIGLFEGEKKVLLTPSDADVEVPIVTRKTVQIINIEGDTAEVMDKETYETYFVKIPEELKEKVEIGKDVEIMEAMGRRKVERVLR